MRAAVLEHPGLDGLHLRDDLELAPVTGRFVRVRVRAAGVCHSDLSAVSGRLGLPTPVVIGHESSGDVVEIGPDVTRVSAGDRVIVSWVPQCGRCLPCTSGQPQLCTFNLTDEYRFPRYRRASGEVWAQAGCGGFAEEILVSDHNLVPLPDDVPYEVGALVGCGVSTGVGAVMNTASVEKGASVVVIGCGGVGLSAVQACRVAEAATVVAVDPVAAKREAAMTLGATHAVDPADLATTVGDLTDGRGFDVAIEAVGAVSTIRAAYEVVRRGGTAVIVGVGPKDEAVSFSPYELYAGEKHLVGSVFGSTDIRRDFPRIIQHWRDGSLDLERMISAHIPLEGLPAALADLWQGTALRSVLVFEDS
ncbi:MAG: zinc-binding dehydrogenase [Actinomycetota bacterium]|nr:zinc-binding dehydrogenase [Actinomycetota bacterium]